MKLNLFKWAATVVLFVAASIQSFAGPFGLQKGMTRSQLITMVGRKAVIAELPDPLGGTILVVDTLPKPHHEFEKYALEFSKKDGLLKIMAFGADITTASDGEDLRAHYEALKAQLTDSYGTPILESDVLKDSSSRSKPDEFMTALSKHERALECTWMITTSGPLKDNVSTVGLQATASDQNTGEVLLLYEFTGFDSYAEQLQAAEGSTL